MPGSTITPMRRSAVPWLYGLSVLLAVVSPLVFLGVWVADGTLEGVGAALLAAVADLVAAALAAIVATVLAAQRGVRRVRTVVLGHPDGRSGRLGEHRAARWALARDRFAALQRDYAAFESDPRAVAARPALVDVSVPTTEAFVEALADAQVLATPTEPGDPRREEFVAAVDRAVAAWDEARRYADAVAPRMSAPGSTPPHPAETRPPSALPPRHGTPVDEYAAVADAVKQAAARGMRDLRGRLRA
ncbi:hypothetical protein GCM10023201_43100 [Actinomycetospora corticicola]|uniref:Uncharacterized protein n=1 Tax=Actinomycetospora corticicola TaxID=663602 RepID=A0A7Y9DWB0_9PSEU|nr:hypothetical protein [Actinomycetospora corticicola]NYD36599.1 hypothetical protein [Actinomycetospora corticicola]